MRKVRIIAGRVHDESEEIEIIIEVIEGVETYTPDIQLEAIWFDANKLYSFLERNNQ